MELSEYLPHRPPMLLLDRLLEVSAPGATAGLKVPQEGLFHLEGKVPSYLGLEYLAQTAALHAGWLAAEAHQPARLGKLIAVRSLELRRPFFLPQDGLLAQVWLEGEQGATRLYRGTVRREGETEPVVLGTLTVLLEAPP
ncbi:MAG: hypothetical protein A2600_01600 [Candidatus Lambdaproteobacteria bacterium RIFOXYD1_FULL_56_27]|uniref:3-hydroxylacyl-ACP dehydratase n=1 Tax=Candidatus Lambdaproteobacteria bacterium RIFOXYD2_FULL_56_26 TaxID=1817773 RepID=A0A1F6GN14_9PROT|nr:MAG: hypothetical protein A2557_12830 [Candidatus Lambdaproteobacteria bacterium RIFOXYD2_FULL_56_26]OGH05541.1 MAG: hypothetical protein A2426_04390 [Candidatus Lambdaproteobacteria bacterium RIFOXYC1_FULL_56_13]OGH08500.1 MAG: hypothetical protein A2600_01600 [Candidatus Lambdaproteobacteria bacterium RIFOXYD1_FULL_56_27]